MQKTLSQKQLVLAADLKKDGYKLQVLDSQYNAVFKKGNTTIKLIPNTLRNERK